MVGAKFTCGHMKRKEKESVKKSANGRGGLSSGCTGFPSLEILTGWVVNCFPESCAPPLSKDD
jgi:hypothetical protein